MRLERTDIYSTRFGLLAAIEDALGSLVELLAAALVAAEAIILFAGVISRYVFQKPLTWTDEVAIALFLWLSMLGAAVALRRGSHMRLTLAIDRLPLRWRKRFDAAWRIVAMAFLAALVVPAIQYTLDVRYDITPSLRFSASYRAVAIIVGVVAMLITLLRQLVETTTWPDILRVGTVLLLVGALGYAVSPILANLGNGNLVVFFLGLLPVLILLGLPIAFAFGFSSMAFLACVTDVPITIVVNRMDEGMSDIILLSIPLFILLGELIVATGMAATMLVFLKSLLKPVRNGLYYVLVLGMYLVSGVSGSKSADMAAVAPVLFPEMKREGADEGDLVALLSASGAMAETIPPSIILIAIGAATGVSIAELFTGGLLPAAVGAVMLLSVVYSRSRRLALPVERIDLREVGWTGLVALPGLLLPVMIRGAVVNGVATATEVATIGLVYCLLCGLLVYRKFPFHLLRRMLVSAASLSAAILFLIGTATVMAWALTQSGFSEMLGTIMNGIPGGKFGFLAMSILVFAVLGSVLEGFPAIILLGPLLFPIARSFGVDGVQYAMVAVLSMSLGLFAPPLGVGYYSACAIGQVSPDRAFARIWLYLGALLVAVILVAAIPWISIGFLSR